VFTEEGKEKASTLDIEYGGSGSSIDYIAGRTIRPDGSIQELSKDAVHDRVVAKAGGRKIQAKSLAMPGVEVGSIVEYRWKEIRDRSGLRPFSLQFQREYPVQKVTYLILPLPRQELEYYGINAQMVSRPFNCHPSPFTVDHDGYNITSLENVPAFREEPMMPGQPNVRPWLLISYRDSGDMRRDPDKYWSNAGKKLYGTLKQSLKTNGDVKKAAADAVNGAKNDNEKVVRLIQYIRANVRDVWAHDVSEEERAKFFKKRPKDREASAAEIYKSGMGTATEVNILFAAMAIEVGLDARPALIADRNDFIFNKALAEDYFLDNIDMAVMIGGKWKVYDVSARDLPPDMLSWREEGVPALVTDPKDPQFIVTPVSLPEASRKIRSAHLTLTDDGTMEGEVDLKWTGHEAWLERVELEGESESRQLEKEKDTIVAEYPQAEVSDLHLDNLTKTDQPFELRYHIRIPQYAGRTGKRILFQPMFFERGDGPLFTSADRQYDVYFANAWRESDDVSIRLPDGFALEKPESPGEQPFGTVGSYAVNMRIVDNNKLTFTRELVFGNKGGIFFGRDKYPIVKNIFDEINRRDSVTLSLKQAQAAVEESQ